jgi:tRNA nucleotidyltransferase (CCA-adding enzyme)
MAANGSQSPPGIAEAAKIAGVRPPDPTELLAWVRALPAGEPLMRRLEGEPGVFLVGGAVRDLLLGGEPTDLDLVVEGDPAPILARLDGEVVIHDRFGTSTATVDGRSYDVARARRETYPRPGALPEVVPGTLEEDLRRRDFTVNAIAAALGGPSAGDLRAFPGALDDLAGRRLRVLHDRSFVDDPTRALRLARYHARLGFAVEPHTRALVREAVEHGVLGTLTGPRVGNELRLLVRERDPVAGLLALRELQLDRAIDPRFGLDDEALARRALALLPPDGRRDLLALAIASQRLPAEELRRLLDWLGFQSGERAVAVAAATRAGALARELERAERPSEIAAAAFGAPSELVALAGVLGPADAAREWLDRLRHVELEIDGRDLLAAGVPLGPAVGRGLRAALLAKIDGRTPSQGDELAVALEAARPGG